MRPFTFLVAVLAVTPLSTVAAQDSPVIPVGVGLGVGAAVGAFVGLVASVDDPHGRGSPSACSQEGAKCMLVGAAIGGGIGAFGGLAYWVASSAEQRGVNPIFVRGTAGLLLGAAAGAGLGISAEDRDASLVRRGEEPIGNCDETDCVLVGTVAVGILGAGAGVVWGVISKRKARSNQFRVSVAPQRDGRFALGLSVRF